MARLPEEIPDAVLRLALCEDAGPVLHHAVMARFGSWEAAAAASVDDWADVARMQQIGRAHV